MKPVDDISFWKERLRVAKESGLIRKSVYLNNAKDWAFIEDTHKRIIGNLIKPDDYVLDAGCGYGRMANLFSPEKYVGVDFSEDFIENARKLFPYHNFVVTNLKKLPFKEKVFQWSFCISIRAMIVGNCGQNEWERMLKELKRVSEKVLILEYTDPEQYEIL